MRLVLAPKHATFRVRAHIRIQFPTAAALLALPASAAAAI